MAAMLAFGCSEQSDETQEIIDNLVQTGFSADDIQVVGGVVYVGRDAEVSLAASREMLQAGDSSQEQYRTTNLVSTSLSKICIDGSTFTGVFSTALDLAIQNYEEQPLTFAMARTPSSGCSFTINAVIQPGLIGGSAGFPSGGLPFGTITIGGGLATFSVDTIEHVITHEIGHTIGFRHSDFFNSSISCGSGGNEGDAGVGAIHIPGTPTGATVGGSIMSSCFRTSETGELTSTDVTALTALYPMEGFQLFVQNYPALDFGLPSSWQSISGDFNGDGKTDYARLGSTGAWVFFAVGDGTFTTTFQSYVSQSPPLSFGMPSSWTPITGDFNGDGKTDYARLGDAGAWVFFGNADGSFTRGFQTYQSPILGFGLPSPWDTITGDFNGDGKTDYARLGDTGAWVFFGTASGGFTQRFQAYQSPILGFGLPSLWQPITGDFNGDGKTDYARLGDTGAWVFFGTASGGFTQAFQTYPPPVLGFGLPSLWQPIAGDLNGDGKADYARLGNTGAWVFYGSAGGGFTTAFQSYDGLSFGLPSSWQVVTGKFKGGSKLGYARLGGTVAYAYVHH